MWWTTGEAALCFLCVLHPQKLTFDGTLMRLASCWDFAVSTETDAPFRAVRISCCGVWPGLAVPSWIRYVGGLLMRARGRLSTSEYMNENTLTWSSRMTGSTDDPVLMTSS